MYAKGVTATTLDDVRAISGTSKSQLYRHFPDKHALVTAVIDLRARQVLAREEAALRRLNSIAGLRRWRTALVQNNELQHGAFGCSLGSMSSELADSDDTSRSQLADTFKRWQHVIAKGLLRMKNEGSFREDIDVDDLATGLLAALQGGYLLAKTQRDVHPMAVALDMAIDHIDNLTSEPRVRNRLSSR
jgi:TetR/AcrR family transcriptional regulator, transcriptional repressor for nem operon